MILPIIGFIAGLCFILYGANLLTDGASALARRFNLSELVIGLTIVAFGTSLPELVISLSSAISGSSGIAMGNVIGSNIFNILLILGVTAIICPITFGRDMLTREIPFNLLASFVLLLVSGNFLFFGSGKGEFLTINGGLILLCFFMLFLRYTFAIARSGTIPMTGEVSDNPGDAKEAKQSPSTFRIAVFIIVGLVSLIAGGKFFVYGATAIAFALGISEAIVGITIVSAGSSMPELAVSIAAARKGNIGITLGNIIGSNIFNVFFILGCTAVISPISLGEFRSFEYYLLIAASLLLYIVAKFFGNNTINRYEGAMLTLAYIGYIFYLIYDI